MLDLANRETEVQMLFSMQYLSFKSIMIFCKFML